MGSTMHAVRIWSCILEYLTVLIILSFIHRTECLTCLSCTDIVLPRDCQYVEDCAKQEECFVESYVTRSGSVRFNVGCRDKLRCQSTRMKRQIGNWTGNKSRSFKMPATQVKLEHMIQQVTRVDLGDKFESLQAEDQGDVYTCTECCNDADVCNNRGCNEAGFSPAMGPLCYNCEQQRSPTDCNKVTLCGPHEMCQLTEIQINGDNLFMSRCAAISEDCSIFRGPTVRGLSGRSLEGQHTNGQPVLNDHDIDDRSVLNGHRINEGSIISDRTVVKDQRIDEQPVVYDMPVLSDRFRDGGQSVSTEGCINCCFTTLCNNRCRPYRPYRPSGDTCTDSSVCRELMILYNGGLCSRKDLARVVCRRTCNLCLTTRPTSTVTPQPPDMRTPTITPAPPNVRTPPLPDFVGK